MLQKINLAFLVQNLFYFIPISLVLGSLIINITLVIFIFLSGIYIVKNNIKINYNFHNIFLFLFFLFIIFSSLINIKVIGYENFIKSILLFKFFLIYIFLETLLIHKKIQLKIFFIICLSLIIFVSLDSILQFHTGKNILGFPLHDGRVGSIFGSEAIAGAFIQKFFIFSLACVYILTNKENLKINYYEIFFLLITLYATFVASNRMSFLIVAFSILIIFFSFNRYKKNLFIIFLILLPIFFYMFNSNNIINSKYNDLKHKISSAVNIFYQGNKEMNLSPDNYGRIYYTTLKSFEDNIFIGNGLKSFRYKCPKLSKDEKILCSTHPHNYHLEVLHDGGLIGFILLSLFVFSVLITKIKIILKHSLNQYDKIVFSLILLNFLIEVFPLKSTGSLFSTWTGTILWISLSMMGFINKNNYDTKNNN